MKRISDEWRQWIEGVLLTDPAEDVSWDVGLAALPDPSQVGSFVGYLAIEMMIPGYPLTDDQDQSPTVVTHRSLLPPFAPREQVEAQVRTLLAELIQRRDDPNNDLDPHVAPSPNVGIWRPLSTGTDTP